MAEKLPQSLRQRLVPLFKEILAYHWVEDLTFNRLSGAVYQVLLSEENSRLTEDAAVDLGLILLAGNASRNYWRTMTRSCRNAKSRPESRCRASSTT